MPLNATQPLLRPDWPAPAGVQAVCTTRLHPTGTSASAPPYQGFNLGDHVGDSPQAVHANRLALAQVLGARPVYLRQVHGCEVQRLSAQSPDHLQADASLSLEPGLACTVLVADCLPVLLCSADGRVVAAAHAGWRGLAAGVLQASVAALRQHWAQAQGSGPAPQASRVLQEGPQVPVLAWLGPCIGPAVFEVGPEVRSAFVARNPAYGAGFQPHGPDKYRADLATLARWQLQAFGAVAVYGNDSTPAWCTVSNRALWYSHRRDRISGRMAACVWR